MNIKRVHKTKADNCKYKIRLHKQWREWKWLVVPNQPWRLYPGEHSEKNNIICSQDELEWATAKTTYRRNRERPKLRQRIKHCFKTAICLCLFFRWGSSIVSPTKQRAWRQKRLDTAWQQPCQFSQKSVYFESSRRQWPSDPFLFSIYLSPLRRLCCFWCVLIRDSKVALVISGLQWYLGWRRSACTTISFLPNGITAVGNGSIRAGIFIRLLGCFTVEKWAFNFKRV